MMPEADHDSEHASAKLVHSLEHESNDLWKQHRLVALTTLTLPIWASLVALTAAFVWGGGELVRHLLIAVLASIVAGRLIILGGHGPEADTGFSALQLAALVLCMDTIWAIVLTWHAGALLHVPWIGPRLKSAVQEGNLLIRSNRWMRNLTVAVVLVFVTLPISSTGSIGGSLLGRLLGLSRLTTFVVVLIGSVIGGLVMYLGAEALAPFFRDSHPSVRYGGVALVAGLLWILSRRYRRSIST
ncbi:MAG: hypothetical protein R3C59_00875 [Planctomycetaceae bacterium]